MRSSKKLFKIMYNKGEKMERYSNIVLNLPVGINYTTSKGENGELIFELTHDKTSRIAEVNIAFERKETLEISDVTSDVSKDKDKHFIKVTNKDREIVRKWLKTFDNPTKKKESFLEIVKQAIKEIKYEYWIATIELSVKNGRIFYAEEQPVGVDYSYPQWKEMAENYNPKRGSRLANLQELFLWYAVRIAKGLWTIDDVVIDSTKCGNYRNALDGRHRMEKTGARICGGYRDGQGNTYKIVTNNGHFLLIGGCFHCHGDDYTIASIHNGNSPRCTRSYGSGVLVYTK